MPLHSLRGSGVWSDLLMASHTTVQPPRYVPSSYAQDAASNPSSSPWSSRAFDLTRRVATVRAQHAFDLQRDRADRERAWKIVQAEANHAAQTHRQPEAIPDFISSNPADALRHRAQVAAWTYLPAAGGRESTFPFSPIARKPLAGSGRTPFSAPSKLSHRDRLILDAFDFSYKKSPQPRFDQPEIPQHLQQGSTWPAASNHLSSDERTSGNTSSSFSAFRTATSSSSHEFTSGSSDPLSSLAELTEGFSQRGETTETSGSERDGRRMFRVENRAHREEHSRADRKRGSPPSIQAPPITTVPDREAQLVLSPFAAGAKGSLQRNQPLVHQFATPGTDPSFGSPLTHRSDMSTLLGLTPATSHTRAAPTFGLSETDRSLASPLTPLQPPSSQLRGLSPSRFQQASEATRGGAAGLTTRGAIPSGSSSSALHSSTDAGHTSSSDRDVLSMYSNSGFLSVTHLDG